MLSGRVEQPSPPAHWEAVQQCGMGLAARWLCALVMWPALSPLDWTCQTTWLDCSEELAPRLRPRGHAAGGMHRMHVARPSHQSPPCAGARHLHPHCTGQGAGGQGIACPRTRQPRGAQPLGAAAGCGSSAGSCAGVLGRPLVPFQTRCESSYFTWHVPLKLADGVPPLNASCKQRWCTLGCRSVSLLPLRIIVMPCPQLARRRCYWQGTYAAACYSHSAASFPAPHLLLTRRCTCWWRC